MTEISLKKRVWGWFFFDWASQPYNTLLLTFIFAPYIKELLGDGSRAQAAWGYGVGLTGLIIALLAPLLGAVADRAGRRLPFIRLFSVFYVTGAALLWFSAPGDYNLIFLLAAFGLGLIGMEFATIFTNAMLPDLGPREVIGKISGSGWAFGYIGGMVALIIMLAVFQIGPSGKTMAGLPPLFGLDPATKEGTRIVGPLTAAWYAVFMVPFFLWVREKPAPGAVSIGTALRGAFPELRASLGRLTADGGSALSFLASSMFYRDALNGIYAFGGIYAVGVLDWSLTQVGLFGILGTITGATFAWIGGRADVRFGPKVVIAFTVIVLALVTLGIIFVSRGSVFGIAVAADSRLPDIAFYVLGGMIGAAGGALQSASRTMMVRQAHPAHMTEAFGLYALTGKATAFIAPLTIGVATDLTGNQQAGIAPLIGLFLLGLFLLLLVKPDGDPRR
ncbi:MFS transporter [Frigidibacter sp. SLM-1]|nr:MFS transporter [Frigidibacter sp. ROC022]MCR8724715.1 MFS transporter [Frigidibacter sp. ROC022]